MTFAVDISAGSAYKEDDISSGLVGDISYNYFDKEGELIDCKWNRQLISLNIEEIKRIPEVIAVTEGTEKAASLYAALKHKIVDDRDGSEKAYGKGKLILK